MKKICWQITVAAFMQPLQYDLRSPAAKDNSITYAAKAGSNLAIPFTLREGYYSCKSQWNSIGNSSTSATCNPIYIAGTILQLQFTMEFCRPHIDETQLKPHLQCGTDPRPIRPWSDHDPRMIRPHTRPSRTRRTAEVDHRRSGTHFVWKNVGFRASAISQKRISCETTNATTARSNLDAAITMQSAETELQKTIELRALECGNCSSKTGSRRQSEKKKDFEALFKKIFRRKITSAKLKKICWQITVAAFMQPLQYDLRSPAAKDNSITYAAKAGSNLAIPFTLREGYYSCKSQWNSIGNSSTSATCNPIYIAGTILQLQFTMEFCRPHIDETQLKPHLQCGTDPRPIRPWSDHDPRMIRGWSDHTRDRLAPVAPQR